MLPSFQYILKFKVKKGKILVQDTKKIFRDRLKKGSKIEAPFRHVALRALYPGGGKFEPWGFWEPGQNCPS
ncbi:hypothetical protein ACQP3F_30930, partial [Escherichia coli]